VVCGPAEGIAKAAELTKGLKSDDEKIHAIYNFVSLKFHYIGLDFGIGRYQPHAADDVLDNGYGDCKDKHTLLASLLKAAGIDAWPVLIHATRKLDPDVPSPAQFNHVISAVPEGDKLVWLDTTPEVAPFGLLMLTLRGKQALVIPTNKAPKLATTPENPPQPQRQEFSMSGKLNTDGVFTGHAEQIYEGDVEVALRAAFRQVPESQWKELVQRISRRLNFAGDVSEVKVSAADEIDEPLLISYDYERKNFGDFENHHTIAPLPPMGIEFTRDSKDRKPPEPVLLGSVGKVTYRARVELPTGYKVLPQSPVHLAESFADYDSRTIVDEQWMTITRVLTIKKSEVQLSDWEAFRKFGQGVNDDESNFMGLEGSSTGVLGGKDSGKESVEARDKGDTVKAEKLAPADVAKLFHDGEYALQQRDFQKAQELFENVIAADPNFKGAHFDLGMALGARNNVTDSIEQFRAEEKVSPENVRSYQIVAMFLTQTNKHDEAIQEWRKLLKVDPENRTAALALGGLLYRSGKYPEAVDVLETAVKTAPDSSSLQMQLGASYIKMGQNEKAIASFRKVVDQKGDDPGILNEIAYTLAENKLRIDLAQQYAETAVKKLEAESVRVVAEADTSARVVYQLSLTWDTLGWIYFLNGDTSRSESYVRAAWLLGQAAEVGEHLGEIYEKEGNKKAAAHTYELALAAAGEAPIYPGGRALPTAPNGSGSLASEITSRYQKLTGTKPSIRETNRLPNGKWTKSVVEEFSDMRTIKFGKQPNTSGSATFSIVFAPGKIEAVDYQSGEQSLKALTERIKAAQYQVEFPPESAARIRRQALANCSSISGCMVVLVPPAPPRSLPNYSPSY
jgi:tetratricopeptide (TPR) repeat protein